MISKPILKIDKFSGMFDGSQTVYLDSLLLENRVKRSKTYSTLNVRITLLSVNLIGLWYRICLSFNRL